MIPLPGNDRARRKKCGASSVRKFAVPIVDELKRSPDCFINTAKMLRISAMKSTVRPTNGLASNKASSRASRVVAKASTRGSAAGRLAKPLGGIPALYRRVVARASSAETPTLDMGGSGGDGADKPPKKKTGDHEGGGHDRFHLMGEFFIQLFNKFAAILLVYKGLQASYFCFIYACKDGCGCVGNGEYFNKARVVLGRGVLISLEFLLISDILETMLFGANLDRLIAIGLTATIRTMIDYFTSKEIEEAEEALERLEAKGGSHHHH